MKSKLSILLSIFMLISCLGGISFTAMAEDAVATTATAITCQADLEAIDTEEELAASYILANNIVLDSTYVSIANFAGTFDGNGKTIYFNETTNGLFASTAANSIVKNVITMGEIINASYYTAAIIGDSNSIVENCINYADVTGESYLGGIVGRMASGSVTLCKNYGDIKNTARTTSPSGFNGSYTGGIIGGAASSAKNTVSDCYNFGSVNAVHSYVGGIIGLSYGPITNCGNIGDISGNKNAGSLGGIVGADYGANISKCYNLGSILSNANGGAGIVGGAYGGSNNIVDCFNAGDVTNPNAYSETTAQEKTEADGGTDEDGNGEIGNKYISGANNAVGGVVGFAASRGTGYIITNCYNTGIITQNNVDVSINNGVLGVVNPNQKASSKITVAPKFTNCYYLGSESDLYDGTIMKNQEELSSLDMIAALNTTETVIWKESTDSSYSYPVLTGVDFYDEITETPEFVIEIGSVEEFALISKNPGANYKLTADITLGEGNKSDGTITSSYEPFAFSGKLDGNGKTVTVYINSSADNQGLFSIIEDGSTIENLTVDGIIKGKNYVGGVAGIIGSTTLSTGVNIEKCINLADINITGQRGGGIVGDSFANINSRPVKITGCINKGNVTVKSNWGGGITGVSAASVTIADCANYADVKSGGSTGGIVGSLYGNLNHCYNQGVIDGVSAGGIIGDLLNRVTVIDNCLNKGAVTGTTYGGIIALDKYGKSDDRTGYCEFLYNDYSFADEKVSIVGAIETNIDYSIYKNCYYKSDSSSSETAGIPIAEPSQDILEAAGFDFDNIWEIKDGVLSLQAFDYIEREDGSVDYPYVINDQKEFENISLNLSAYYILGNDITLTDHTPVIGFKGYFDGNGKTVNLNTKTAMFASTTSAATIINVTTDGSVNGGQYAAAIVGENVGKIINCINKASVSGSLHMAGIAGKSGGNDTIISGCVNTGAITGTSWCVGGIVGYNTGSEITGCVNIASVTSSHSSGYIGGIVGHNATGKLISNCYNIGDITGKPYVGGIVGGTNTATPYIADCFNTGKIYSSSASSTIGGITGGTSTAISTEEGKYNYLNCYNIGSVMSGNNDCSNEKSIYGEYVADATAPSVSSCYYLGDSVTPAISGITALTADQMATQSTYAESWDFEKVWTWASGAYKYPVLASVEFLMKKGVELNPYVINNQADFENIKNDLTAYYVLGDNISLVNHTPVAEFSGNFNGNGYTVDISSSFGLFASTTANAVIKNVNTTGEITGIITENTENLVAADFGFPIGAIVGENKGIIENCTNAASVYGLKWIGGISGRGSGGSVTGCLNKGKVSSYQAYTGGIIGYNGGTTIKSCGNTGLVTTLNDTGNIGGIVGQQQTVAAITECYNNGTIIAPDYAGGIVGNLNVSLPNINNCFNAADVTITKASKINVGGIIGKINVEAAEKADSSAHIYNCYNVGTITSSQGNVSDEKAIYGDFTTTAPKFASCYYLGEATEVAKEGIAAKTSNELEALNSSDAGWNFTDVWGSYNGKENYKYPVLETIGFIVEAGSKIAPIYISNAEEFAAMADSSKYYAVSDDFTITSDSYNPIAFAGKLDGQGHTITINIITSWEKATVEDSSKANIGLFSVLSGNYEIKNLKLAGEFNAINSNPKTGSLGNLGVLAGTISEKSTGTIKDCVSSVDLSYNHYDYVGGFVGKAHAANAYMTMDGLVNNGSITLTGDSSNNVGGITGVTAYNVVVKNCINNADIISANIVGGIVGNMYASITNCINNGDIYAEDIAGGIAANTSSTSDMVIADCYNTGDINDKATIDSTLIRVGGILGFDNKGGTTIESCYNVGAVLRNDENYMNISGLAGGYNTNASATIISNSYYLSDSDAENAKTKAELVDAANALGDAYVTSTSANYTFPQLANLPNEVAINIIKIPSVSVENATVNLSKEYAKVGSEVVLTVNADEGYELSDVTVDGNPIEAVNGKYTFTAVETGNIISVTVNASVKAPSITIDVYEGNTLSAMDLSIYGVANPLSYIGKNVILVTVLVEGEDVTEVALSVGGNELNVTEHIESGKAEVFMFHGLGIEGTTVYVKGYATNAAGDGYAESQQAVVNTITFN